jgi:uncharacterized protein YjiS (DUF1127 family)
MNMHTQTLRLSTRTLAPVQPKPARKLTLFAWLIRWIEARRDRRLLLSMNDAALKDIGISRSEVYHVTRNGR